MAYNLGQAAIVSKGAWSSGTTYELLNTVSHNGGSFMAITQNSGVEPGVTAGWASSWVSMSLGIKTIDIVAESTSQAHAVITLSDGTTVTGSTFNTAAIAAGAVGTTELANSGVTTAKLANGSVTAAKLGTDILPSNVGIKMGTATPTTSTISNGQIYLKYS